MLQGSKFTKKLLKELETKKPPIGIKPRYIHDSFRRNEIKDAISRYIQANVKIPLKWVTEYNEIIEREHRRTK